ncbi:uncharacterized protein M6B38_283210 [Iris pallida]|uniref:V-type proton ATPase subunit S1/VOA1 transmembrane domain-containing protein n=1 Tax=Iris pallida TaxID=29817 RepID=A0AAX6I2R6_IRIPA|nr:uncharacterized protein M6B38_283210 [Iris pallida]
MIRLLLQGKMEGLARPLMLSIVLLAAQISCVVPSPTVPAFLWSPKSYGLLHSDVKEVVNYQTISAKDLAKSVLSDGGWSNLLCSEKSDQQDVDVALVYIGRKLQSSEISKTKHEDSTLLNLLKDSFTSSNVSIAFPYVAMSDGKDTLENSLITGFTENCGQGLGVNHIAYMNSCSLNGDNLKKLHGLQSFQDFVGSRMETKARGNTDLIVFCDEVAEESDLAQSEGKVLSGLVNFLEQSGAAYTVLYASDSYRSMQYPRLALSRFLAEGNASSDSTVCDGVCQIKSSLLEGIFVGIVLLIILLSGLCCMMGIDTPTRFEAPQES